MIHNATARFLTKTLKIEQNTLKSLRWLHEDQRIDFEMVLLIYKSLSATIL